jgi:hypothetical protein
MKIIDSVFWSLWGMNFVDCYLFIVRAYHYNCFWRYDRVSCKVFLINVRFDLRILTFNVLKTGAWSVASRPTAWAPSLVSSATTLVSGRASLLNHPFQPLALLESAPCVRLH